MTIQYKLRNKVNTIRISIDTMRVAGIVCLISCAVALASGIIYWSYNGFSWLVLLATLCALLASMLTVCLLALKSEIDRYNAMYGTPKEGEDE